MNTEQSIRGARKAGVALLLLIIGGCFQYTQIPLAQARVGKDVRVHLTDAGYARLRETAGDQVPGLRRTIEGPLIASNDQRILVAVPVFSERPAERATLQQRLAIPVFGVLGIERKMLNRRKTTIIAAGATAALIAFIAYYVSGEFGGTTSPLPEPGQGESIQLQFRLSR